MDSLIVPTASLWELLLEIYPPRLRELIVSGRDALRLEAASLGFEILRAEHAEISFAEAARRPGFPLMTRLHHGVIDFLQRELPDDERALVQELFDHAKSMSTASGEPLRAVLFSLAGSEGQQLEPALARFALYQVLRVSIWIGTWHVVEAAELEATGTLLELDQSAERRLRDRLRMQAMNTSDVRPVTILLAEIFEVLETTLAERREQIRNEGAQFMHHMEKMIQATAIARRLDDGDGVILRNEIDAALGRDSAQTILLVERHQDALTSVDATKQRRVRLRTRLTNGEDTTPRRSRVIDVVTNFLQELE